MNHEKCLIDLIRNDDAEGIRKYVKQYPESVTAYRNDRVTPWMVSFQISDNYEVVKAALESGFPVNTLRLPEEWHPLASAISSKQLRLVALLLEHQADPNMDRCILRAVKAESHFALECLKLLLASGLLLNRVFQMFDEPGTEFTALDEVDKKSPVYEFLRKHGAKHYSELRSSSKRK
jgi:Ankyrin repeats (many copies)